MPHIHTKPGQIDHTATAFIVRLDGAEPRLLLHLHKKHGRLLPTGGHIELDETPWSAIAHEIREESGYELTQLNVLQPLLRIQPQPGVVLHPQPLCTNTHDISQDHYHTDTAYLFVTHDEPLHTPQDGESTDLRWLTAAEITALTGDEIFRNTRLTAAHVFSDFLQAWQPVSATDFSVSKEPELP